MAPAKMIQAHDTTPMQDPRDVLDEICRQGARQMLQTALENEVDEYLAAHAAHRDDSGRQMVVRNGYLPERKIVTGMGPLPLCQPRVRHKNTGDRFTSQILPPYLRRVPSIDALIPALYLKGVSTGDFTEALSAILGKDAAGLSATNIVRLKKVWEEEYREWSKRDLSGKRYVYLWADGIYFNVRLEDDRICMLVLMAALPDGTKEMVAILDGFRESADSWAELLRNLKKRGLEKPPALAVGDGALGFWKALDQVFPQTRRQRCWVHKTANILDKMPQSVHSHAKTMIHEMYMAPTKEDALKAYGAFLEKYKAKYPRACDSLERDADDLFTFYDFPAEHWQHLRTTNPIESTFATVRLRTRRTKGCGSTATTLTMIFKLGLEAQQHWRRLKGSQQIAKVIEGKRFINGIQEDEKAA